MTAKQYHPLKAGRTPSERPAQRLEYNNIIWVHVLEWMDVCTIQMSNPSITQSKSSKLYSRPTKILYHHHHHHHYPTRQPPIPKSVVCKHGKKPATILDPIPTLPHTKKGKVRETGGRVVMAGRCRSSSSVPCSFSPGRLTFLTEQVLPGLPGDWPSTNNRRADTCAG